MIAGLRPADTSAASAQRYYVSPQGADTNAGTTANAPFATVQKAVDLAQPGDSITLASGEYLQDVVSKRNGSPSAPITISGPADAIVKGAGNGRIVEVRHDYLTFDGFTIDGLYGNPNSSDSYRDKLLYVIGDAPLDGVSGLKVLNMTFRNGGGECLRLRYFVQNSEIAQSTFLNCGVRDFRFKAGGKNGEAIYIGTAPEQRGDGKNPTTDPDQSNNNWIHHNNFNTQGNECVDIKEAATNNIVENNTCTGQKDPNSAGFDSRGSGNIFRYNTSYGNVGAGVRLGGDTATDGIDNQVYANILHHNDAGGIKFQRAPQRTICGNTINDNRGGDATGSYPDRYNPTAPCQNASLAVTTRVFLPISQRR
ncbi:MAG: right-handed parallel beta-helix repeat-containing protein [Roseiflexaceae bacterium]|nr:right-handed parallel beta-helix repeat-containing protein [Roseiflexaceae bacterium]